MNIFLVFLALVALVACKKKDDSPKSPVITKSASSASPNEGQTSSNGNNSSSSDSGKGASAEIEEPIKLTQSFLMNKDTFAYCQTFHFDEPRYVFPDISTSIVAGECPSTNELKAGILKTCPATYDEVEKSSTTTVVYKVMKLEDGSSKTLNEADANDLCDLFAKGPGE